MLMTREASHSADGTLPRVVWFQQMLHSLLMGLALDVFQPLFTLLLGGTRGDGNLCSTGLTLDDPSAEFVT